MDHSHNRFVAHLDILGMREIVRKDHDAAWRMLSDLAEARDTATNTSLEHVGSGKTTHTPEVLHAITFSDTIFLFSRGATDEDLETLVVAVTQLFYKALYAGVPIRAGISYGVCYINIKKSMYAGPAVIEAYDVGEAAQWLGIVFSKTLEGREKSLGLTNGKSNLIVDWPVPLKQGTIDLSVVNWPASVAHNFTVTPPLTAAQFYEIFQGTFGPMDQLSANDLSKYSNTVNFINAQFAAHVEA